ncbi:MAG: hypothetical protein ACOH2V_00420 [Candidatus Saccharimonadaceae bacterium]
MIKLTALEVRWIRMCKSLLIHEYPCQDNWIENFKPMFLEACGWDPNTDKPCYLKGLFQILFNIYLKIQPDGFERNSYLKALFSESFEKTWSTDPELPIERVIIGLQQMIQFNSVTDSGVLRYDINVVIPFSIAQKHLIYKIALRILQEQDPVEQTGLCAVLSDASAYVTQVSAYYGGLEKYFPEVFSKKPKETYTDAYWFLVTDKESRIKILQEAYIETNI